MEGSCLAPCNLKSLTADVHTAIRLIEDHKAASWVNRKLGKSWPNCKKLCSISRGKLGENSPHLSIITRIVHYTGYFAALGTYLGGNLKHSLASHPHLFFFCLSSTSFLADTTKPRRSKVLQAAKLLSPSSCCFPIA